MHSNVISVRITNVMVCEKVKHSTQFWFEER